MRKIAFRNGTLIIALPDRFADPVVIDLRAHADEWAFIATSRKERINGFGYYLEFQNKIEVTGHEIETMPDWWDYGRPIGYHSNLIPIDPFNRTVTFLSDTVIHIGQD